MRGIPGQVPAASFHDIGTAAGRSPAGHAAGVRVTYGAAVGRAGARGLPIMAAGQTAVGARDSSSKGIISFKRVRRAIPPFV